MFRPVMICLLLGAGCTNIPELKSAVPDWVADAPYPQLVPLPETLTLLPAPAAQSAELQQDLDARVARLKARAERLRGPVVSSADQDRLRDEIDGS